MIEGTVTTITREFAAPTVKVSPDTVDVGQSASLSVVTDVSGGTSPYSYQWVSEAPGASSYSDLGSAISAASSASTGSLTLGTWKFELVVTDATTASVTSNEVSVTVNPAAASTLVVTGFPSPAVAGEAHIFTVTAQDPYGNTATSYTGTVAITSDDGKAVLPSSAGLTKGVGTFSVTLETVGTWSITATDTVTSSITGSQTGIVVTADVLASIKIGESAPSVVAGNAVTFTAEGFDQYKNDLGPVTASYTVNTNPIVGSSDTETKVGTYTVEASYSGFKDSTSFTVTATKLDHFTWTNVPTSTTSDVGLISTVTAYDAYGNIKTDYVGMVHFTSSDSAAVLPSDYTYVAGDSGAHTFSFTLKTVGGQTLTVADGSISATTSSITVTQNQYKVSFTQTGSGTAPTVTYSIGGGTLTGTVPFYVMVSVGSSITYTYQATVPGATGVQYVLTSTTPSSPQTPSGDLTVTGAYKTQYQQTFGSSGLAADATGNMVFFSVSGGSYSGATSPIGVAGGSVWVDSGASISYTFVNPVTSSVMGKRYGLSSSTGPASGYTVSAANTLTATYVTQYQLTMATNLGTTSPSVGNTWYNVGSKVTISATSPTSGSGERYVWAGWTGTGTGSYTGCTASPSITMIGPITETAAWTHQYQVSFTVNPSGAGTTTPSGTGVWETAGSLSISAKANPCYSFSSWSSNTGSITFASAGSTSTSATISGPGTITANFASRKHGERNHHLKPSRIRVRGGRRRQ